MALLPVARGSLPRIVTSPKGGICVSRGRKPAEDRVSKTQNPPRGGRQSLVNYAVTLRQSQIADIDSKIAS